jgi:hypothetical protein
LVNYNRSLLNGKSDFQDGCLEAKNRSNCENQKKLGILHKGILTPSFIEIALAAPKCALLTDNNGQC